MYRKQRIEALSDGIFAVVMTLLVIDLHIPTDTAPGHLVEALHHERLAFLAFAITFGIAARYWTLQHRVFELVEDFHRHALVLTFLFLAFVTLLPFTTALMSRYGADPVAFRLYALNQTVIGACLIGKLEVLHHRNGKTLAHELRSLRIRLWSLTAAMATAGILSLFVPMGAILLAPALFIFGTRRILRLQDKHHTTA